jgi:hypothetical protein
MNSVNPDTDGNLLVSSRHTWTVLASRLSEFDAAGRLLFDATLPAPSYRCYRDRVG